MRSATHPVAENVHHLQQTRALIRLLDDETFARQPEGPFRGGVGSQLRHCIDFYGCFLAGLERGRVDYTQRERDPSIECDRQRAAQRIEEVLAAVETLDPQLLERELQVKSEPTRERDDRHAWCRSTVHRELQFLVSHTVHHHALVLSLLRQQGVLVGEKLELFGVAPSTATHWAATGPVSSPNRSSEA